MNYKYSRQSGKFLEKIDKTTALRILTAINKLPEGDVKKLREYKNLYRLRVGDLRITFSRDGNLITVEEIDYRGGIY